MYGIAVKILNKTLFLCYFSESIKNMGQLICYGQDQLDVLFQLVMQTTDDKHPDGALISQMGSLSGKFNYLY